MGRDAIAELIALSGATERIAFGTGIIPVFGRTPTLTAAAMTTVFWPSSQAMSIGFCSIMSK